MLLQAYRAHVRCLLPCAIRSASTHFGFQNVPEHEKTAKGMFDIIHLIKLSNI